MAEEFNEKKKKSFKLADAPHWVSMIFSIAALVVSGLSWQESHKSRLINESSNKINQNTNRALVYVINVQLIVDEYERKDARDPWYDDFAHLDHIAASSEYKLAVKNIGRVSAKNVRLHYAVLNIESPTFEENKRKFEEQIEPESSTLKEILPGLQEEIPISIPWHYDDFETNWVGEKTTIEDFSLICRLIYEDEITGETFQFNCCYQLSEKKALVQKNKTEIYLRPCPRIYKEFE